MLQTFACLGEQAVNNWIPPDGMKVLRRVVWAIKVGGKEEQGEGTTRVAGMP